MAGRMAPPVRTDGMLPAALAVICVALAFVGIMFGVRVERAEADQARRAAALDTAKAAAVYLTTVDYRHLDQNSGRLLAMSVGQFKDSYAARLKQVETLISSSRSSSQGTVLEAGIVSVSPKAARVFVAANSRTTSATNLSGSIQHYRMQLDLQRADGRWLVSDVAFVS
ncbi:MAG: hypothetical protein L0Y54_07790 [Sporichthyaceae bacterium]|nr:hypothetical protein [Sporichthyaceae bacterium]